MAVCLLVWPRYRYPFQQDCPGFPGPYRAVSSSVNKCFKYLLEIFPHLVKSIKELLVGSSFHFLYGLHKTFFRSYQVILLFQDKLVPFFISVKASMAVGFTSPRFSRRFFIRSRFLLQFFHWCIRFTFLVKDIIPGQF